MSQFVQISYWFLVGLVLAEYVQLISDRGTFLGSILGRSKCDSCNKEIPWYAMVPIFGRFFSSGKCPNCGKKIAWKYFWFEIIFGAGWLAFLIGLYLTAHVGFLLITVSLICYCATFLLMYEDLHKYSVPISWLVFWCIITLAEWYVLGNTTVHIWDTLLTVGVLVLSIGVVALRKPAEERDIANMFGAADVVVLLLYSLLFGFQWTTGILVFTMINAILFLILQNRLKAGQKLPLLTVMLPWGLLAFLFI